jgi:hypothetical protein
MKIPLSTSENDAQEWQPYRKCKSLNEATKDDGMFISPGLQLKEGVGVPS